MAYPAASRIAPRWRAHARSMPGGLIVLKASSSRVSWRGSIRVAMRGILSRSRARGPAPPPHPMVQGLHRDGEREREVEVALGDVEMQAVGDQHHADHD